MYWTDSLINLFWIRGLKTEYKQFVQNRLTHIQELSKPDEGYYIPTKLNPADLPFRGCLISDLLKNTIWIYGPKFMGRPYFDCMVAVIACWLQATILKEFDFTFRRIYHIIDSLIVLQQIHKDSYKFGVFVANCIAEVQTSTEILDWWWTESKNNAADMVTSYQTNKNR